MGRVGAVREQAVVAGGDADASGEVVEEEQHPRLPVVLAVDEAHGTEDRGDGQEDGGDPVDLLEHVGDDVAGLGGVLDQALADELTGARLEQREEVDLLQADGDGLGGRLLEELERLLEVVDGDHGVGLLDPPLLLQVVLALGRLSEVDAFCELTACAGQEDGLLWLNERTSSSSAGRSTLSEVVNWCSEDTA